MLPALLAQDTRDQVISFLETTFSFRDPLVWKGLQRFLDRSIVNRHRNLALPGFQWVCAF